MTVIVTRTPAVAILRTFTPRPGGDMEARVEKGRNHIKGPKGNPGHQIKQAHGGKIQKTSDKPRNGMFDGQGPVQLLEQEQVLPAPSWLVVASLIATDRLYQLSIDPGRRSFYALRHMERYRSKAADALPEIIAEFPRGVGA